MKYLCQGCGRVLAHDGVRVKAVCTDCGVMTDLRDQGFRRPEPTEKLLKSKSELPHQTQEPDHDWFDAESNAPESEIAPAANTPAMELKLVIPDTFQSSIEDDGLAYGVGEVGDFYCPGCARVMVSGSIVCVHCGFNVNKGRKLQRKHSVIQKSWTEGFSRSSRLMSCLIFCGSVVFLLIMGGEFGPEGSRVTMAVAVLAMIQSLVLMGTFGALDLNRNSRGQIKLRRIYWILFCTAKRTEQNVSGYDGIKLTQSSTGGMVDYLMCIILLVPFIIPSILWYFFQIHRSVFEVALTRDRGRMVNRVFMSREEEKAVEIAHILRDMTGLPLNDT